MKCTSGRSFFCETDRATEKLDPSGDTLDLVAICSACTTLIYLETGEPTPGETVTTERDRIYGMGAAA